MKVKNLLLALVACIGLAGTAATSVYGETYPNRPVNLIVGFGPGGASDILARLLATELLLDSGQSVVVENKAGASGIIGTGFVAKAPPDGYTLQLLAGNHTINPALRNDLPFDSVSDITPIILIASAPNILIVREDSPFKSLDDYIATAKAKPGAVSYATSGIGTTVHLAGENFTNRTSTELNHIPYKGSAQSVTAVLSGEVDSAWVALNSSLSFVTSGRVRVLGIASKERSSFLSGVPTFEEQGITGMESDNWLGVSGPGNMPAERIETIQAQVKRILAKESFQRRLTELGLEPVGMGHLDFAALIKDEIRMYAGIVQNSGIKLE